ncbi:hypothetical protein HPP92_021614 [Vanilla planifolia]|uniref:ENTH domain-containing protein n=1 Tax=Vanilla planifolia TaxID=51239 RepID=A0A835UJH3_VANPL|nr:hypothetical protein HPP92_021948 [Vanilla planifolia]KAG0463138.1 hypothetical protein HPP92_021614 [Vanilla planifolia]
MTTSGNTQQSLRKALGALKDTTTVGLVKVNSDYKGLDVAIVKATNHVEQLPKEKHIHTIFKSVSSSRPRADIAYCINSLAKRLAKTQNWAVALKTLIIIHRALREVDASFRAELINHNRSRGHILNLSHFKDDSSPNAWEYSTWVRAYALYLEERLECLSVLKYDIDTECSRAAELDTNELFEHLPALQQLLFRLLGCQPEGAAVYNSVIQFALSIVVGESITIYSAINSCTLNLVDKFFDMQRHDAIRAVEIYRKAGQQAFRLSDFFDVCRRSDFGRGHKFVKVEQPPVSFLAAMEEYVKDTSTRLGHQNLVEANRRIGISKPKLAFENKKPNLLEKPEKPIDLPNQTSRSTPHVGTSLLDFSESATDLEEKNALPLAAVCHDNLFHPSSESDAGWELALVTASTSTVNLANEPRLVGGFDKQTLDCLYDDATARRGRSYNSSDPMGHLVLNPFETQMQESFYGSDAIALPANVQISSNNPFDNPFGLAGSSPYQTQNPHTGLM